MKILSLLLFSVALSAQVTKIPTSKNGGGGGGGGGTSLPGCTTDGASGITCNGGFTGTSFNSPVGTPFSASGAEEAKPTVTSPTIYFDNVTHNLVMIDSSGNYVSSGIQGIADPNVDGNCVYYIGTDGVQHRTPCGGGGTSGIGRTSLSLTFSNIVDGTCQEQTGTWTGVGTTDTIAMGLPASLTINGNARVSAANTVAVRLCNFSGATVNPGTLAFNFVLAVYNISGTSTIDFSSIPDGTCAANNFTLTGVTAGNALVPKWPSTLETGLFGNMIASATDTVTVRLCNWSGGAVNPASQTFGASQAQ